MKIDKSKRFFMSLLALGFPWVILLIDDNPLGALGAMVMQATVIGWIPASMWAWKIIHPEAEVKKKKKSTQKDVVP